MQTETLTIGGLAVAFACTGTAASLLAWDAAHRPFVTTGVPSGACPVACFHVRSGLAPGGDFPELLADGRLWTLRRDPSTDCRRITLHGSPAGPLTMTLDLDPPSGTAPLTGTLFLGTPPPGHSRVPLGYPLMPLLWTLLLGRLAPDSAGLLCHACGVVTPTGDGLLFSGFSGAGKSTTSRLWRTACPQASVLSDDRVLLRRDLSSPTGFTLYGTPWHGDAEDVSTQSAPLCRLFILGRSPDGLRSCLTPLPPAAAAAQLLARSTPPIWDTFGTTAALSLAADVVQTIPADRWDFAPVPAAIRRLLGLETG